MVLELSEEQRILGDSVRRFAQERIGPIQEEDEKAGIFSARNYV